MLKIIGIVNTFVNLYAFGIWSRSGWNNFTIKMIFLFLGIFDLVFTLKAFGYIVKI